MDYKEMGAIASKSDATSRQIVVGRELQYDVDFACYEVANLDEPAAKNFKRLLSRIEYKRKLAGAETVCAHLTLGFNKTGRGDMATVKVYQEDRDPNTPIKVRVRELREMLTTKGFHYVDPIREADDTIITRQAKRIKEHGIQSSVIMSGDKDLWMGQGLHCDPNTGEMWEVTGYGITKYKEVGNVKPKLVGRGYSWFWHQMIMGDTVDKIPGLERIANKTLDKYLPLKSGKARKAGSGQCGESKAVAILKGVRTCREAFRRVLEAYKDYYGDTAQERMFEQGYLLWMQRCEDPYDFMYYLREIGVTLYINDEQRAKLHAFQELHKEVHEIRNTD